MNGIVGRYLMHRAQNSSERVAADAWQFEADGNTDFPPARDITAAFNAAADYIVAEGPDGYGRRRWSLQQVENLLRELGREALEWE